EIARGGRHVQQLRRRGALVREDEGAQAGPCRVRRDRRARVAGADHRGRGEPELERGADGGGGRAVLDGAGRVGAIELDQQSSHAEVPRRSEEHTSELQSPDHLVCRLLLEKKNKQTKDQTEREHNYSRSTRVEKHNV